MCRAPLSRGRGDTGLMWKRHEETTSFRSFLTREAPERRQTKTMVATSYLISSIDDYSMIILTRSNKVVKTWKLIIKARDAFKLHKQYVLRGFCPSWSCASFMAPQS